MWQTLALKRGGDLASEANDLVGHVLNKGPDFFVAFKTAAILLSSLILIRGFYDERGLKVGDISYSQIQVQTAIQFLLVVADIYYIVVVYIPLALVLLSYRSSLP